MIDVKYKSISPAHNYFSPALRLTLELKYIGGQEAILSISGQMSISEKIISIINLESNLLDSTIRAVRYPGEERELTKITQDVELIVPIDHRVVDFIEKSRKSNKKGDVQFKLSISIRSLSNLAQLSNVWALPLRNEQYAKPFVDAFSKSFENKNPNINPLLLFYNYKGKEYWQDHPDLTLIAQNAGTGQISENSGYLVIKTITKDFNEVIPSSDWINDFATVLGLGEFFVIEIPIGGKCLQEAWSYLSKAEESYRRWDISGVMSSCRLAGQALDGNLKNLLGENSFDYRERWKRIYGNGKGGGFNFWTSMPLHTEDIKFKGTGGNRYQEKDVNVGDTDAEAVLLITKSLIKYAERLMNEKEGR